MHIVHIAAECAPLAKVGGLGDVVLGLAREQVEWGDRAEVFLPKYECVHWHHLGNSLKSVATFETVFNGCIYQNTLWKTVYKNFQIYFIDSPKLDFFSRDRIYGYKDDIARFLYFSRAVFDWFEQNQEEPTILHLHDWQSALIAPLWKEMRCSSGTGIVFTIHNLAYQGVCKQKDLSQVGFRPNSPFQDDQNPQFLNLVKGAFMHSDALTTVSPTYAEEILSTNIHRNILPTVKKYQHKMVGILNGLDVKYWNAEIDIYVPYHFSVSSIDQKAQIKQILRKQLNLTEGPYPIIACVSRLVPQKGVELIEHAVKFCVQDGAQFVLLGYAPDKKIRNKFYSLQKKWKNNPHVSLTLHTDEELTHLIFAGSDMLIVPSHFEPCGLTQLIALQYGTVPIVRKTGGLADTIIDVQEKNGNGYVFYAMTRSAITEALVRAITCWKDDPKTWRQIQKEGMRQDFSWKKPALVYRELYEKIGK